MFVQEVSPLTLISQLCCSIDQPAQSRTTKTITDVHAARQSSSFSDQSAVTGMMSFRREINFRSGSHAHSLSLSNPHRGRRRSEPVSRRSTYAAKRHLPSSSAAALDFYFRSLLATRSLAAGLDFRYRSAAIDRHRIFPMFSGIARPCPMRLVPRFPCILPSGSGTVGGPAVDPQVSNVQFPTACGHFRYQSVTSDSLPPHLGWYSSGIECNPSSRDRADIMSTTVTSSVDNGIHHYHQRPVALHWNPSSSVGLRQLPWQPIY